MNTEFNITIASDSEHERVFAEIYCREKFVALVSQEEGLSHLKIEFPPVGMDESMIQRKVGMEEFKRALCLAEQRLAGKSGNQ